MSDWRIPEKVARERADEFARGQRQAFLEGFRSAMDEAESMAELREWLETQREEAAERYEEHGEDSDFVRKIAFKEVLVKISEMGCEPGENEDETES